jgi:hypothetical protein
MRLEFARAPVAIQHLVVMEELAWNHQSRSLVQISDAIHPVRPGGAVITLVRIRSLERK